MLYAKIEDGNIVIGHISQLFPNTSFPISGPTTEWINEYQLLEVVDFIEYNHTTQRLVYGAPVIKEGKVYTCEVIDMTLEEQEIYNNNLIEGQWNIVRSDRNSRLKDCDWTVLPDSPMDKDSWATYRQALRDLTTQSDPFNIVWPTKP